jgi:aspartate/methionine/tyrosine aminotransferase
MSSENISRRASRISPFLVMEVLEQAKEKERKGEDIIHLEVGEPDFPTPVCIKQGALKAIKEGKTHYTHSLGLPELRESIAELYKREYLVRFSYANSLENIKEAMRRIEKYLKEKHKIRNPKFETSTNVQNPNYQNKNV